MLSAIVGACIVGIYIMIAGLMLESDMSAIIKQLIRIADALEKK
jgi:hypothetical protein